MCRLFFGSLHFRKLIFDFSKLVSTWKLCFGTLRNAGRIQNCVILKNSFPIFCIDFQHGSRTLQWTRNWSHCGIQQNFVIGHYCVLSTCWSCLATGHSIPFTSSLPKSILRLRRCTPFSCWLDVFWAKAPLEISFFIFSDANGK